MTDPDGNLRPTTVALRKTALQADAAPTDRRLHGSSWVVVIALLATTTSVGLLLDRHLSITSEAMLYVLAVVFAAHTLKWLP